jgi:alcohol dehydrogenase class IV
MAYPVGGEYHTPHGITLSAILVACFEGILMAKQDKMVLLAGAMGEKVDGLSPREAARKAPEAIRHLLQSVDLPVSLRDLEITDRTKIARWAVEAHKEQRLLSRSPRVLSVKDIEKIYERSF